MAYKTVRMILVGVTIAGALLLPSSLSSQQGSNRSRDIDGIRFIVPPGYEVHKTRDRNVFVFDLVGDPNASSLIKVYLEHRQTGIPGQELTPEKMEILGLRRTGDRTAKLADHEGGCAEYSVKTRSGVPIAQVECSFGTELHTSFFGTPSKLSEFYSFMEAAHRLQRNN